MRVAESEVLKEDTTTTELKENTEASMEKPAEMKSLVAKKLKKEVFDFVKR